MGRCLKSFLEVARFAVPVGMGPGRPEPLGATVEPADAGAGPPARGDEEPRVNVNFAVAAPGASATDGGRDEEEACDWLQSQPRSAQPPCWCWACCERALNARAIRAVFGAAAPRPRDGGAEKKARRKALKAAMREEEKEKHIHLKVD